MTDDPNIYNEADTNIDNKEAPEPLPPEPVTEEPIKNEVTNEEIANEPQFKNKTDRMKHKKVKCNGCNAEMTLKTLRYSHKCSKTEDKPIKPKPKTKPKPKLVTIQPTPTHPKAIESTHEPTYLLEAKQKSIIQEQPIKSPQEIIFDSYKLIHREYINKRKEKYNNLCANMFSGNLRSKRK